MLAQECATQVHLTPRPEPGPEPSPKQPTGIVPAMALCPALSSREPSHRLTVRLDMVKWRSAPRGVHYAPMVRIAVERRPWQGQHRRREVGVSVGTVRNGLSNVVGTRSLHA